MTPSLYACVYIPAIMLLISPFSPILSFVEIKAVFSISIEFQVLQASIIIPQRDLILLLHSPVVYDEPRQDCPGAGSRALRQETEKGRPLFCLNPFLRPSETIPLYHIFLRFPLPAPISTSCRGNSAILKKMLEPCRADYPCANYLPPPFIFQAL